MDEGPKIVKLQHFNAAYDLHVDKLQLCTDA